MLILTSLFPYATPMFRMQSFILPIHQDDATACVKYLYMTKNNILTKTEGICEHVMNNHNNIPLYVLTDICYIVTWSYYIMQYISTILLSVISLVA